MQLRPKSRAGTPGKSCRPARSQSRLLPDPPTRLVCAPLSTSPLLEPAPVPAASRGSSRSARSWLLPSRWGQAALPLYLLLGLVPTARTVAASVAVLPHRTW
eukprot:3939082-Rhodomonas_salina.1